MENMKIYYNSDYTASKYGFDTTRKSAEIAKWLNVHGVDTTDPKDYYQQAENLINRLHAPDYVAAVKTGTPRHLAEAQGFDWDSKIYDMALAHSAGLLAATYAVLVNGEKIAGSLSSGLHHANTAEGTGFCTFNGLSVAATAAHKLGARNILCLDFDAHCGGGTYEMTRDINMTQIDVFTSPFDMYWIDDETDRSRMYEADVYNYLDTIDTALAEAERIGGWDFVIYNAGVDPYNTGVPAGDIYEREQMVAQFVKDGNYPTIFSIAGGYTWGQTTMEQLVDLHVSTVMALSNV
jgi:acetoin utilization deacetylase AcuC-like enzyme